MRPYQWVIFEDDVEKLGEVYSKREFSGAIAMYGYQRVDNDAVLSDLRSALIANGYPEDSRICSHLTNLASVRNPDSACWIPSDVAIRELGMDPIDCLTGHIYDWIRELMEK